MFVSWQRGEKATAHAVYRKRVLSARAHDKILRIARTIADLENESDISPMHLFEAITYRTLDRKLWA
jgi:magnesium chelatase family protein